MSDDSLTTKKSTALVPPAKGPARISNPATVAAGYSGVASSVNHVFRKAGIVRGTRSVLKMNQKGGFDCPSCAWPDPKTRSSFEFCENGAKAVADETTQKRATPAFFRAWSVERMGQQSDKWLNKRGRLTHPMYKPEGSDHYLPVTWDQAFDRLAKHLNGLDSPNEAIFYTSGRTSNEAAWLYQLFVRCYGTNNLPDCSNMCHESTGVGLGESVGVGKGTVTLEDFDKAEVFLIFGQNPGTNHPRMLTPLSEARKRGAKIISINPLKEAGLIRFRNPQSPQDMLSAGTSISTHFLQVKVNGDVALLKGLQKALLAEEARRPGQVLDHALIESKTKGFEDFAASVEATSWEDIERGSGIGRAQLEEVAHIIAGTPRVIACWAMGITQHLNGVSNVQEIANLMLMRGALGLEGAGLCPVRGHSNVQGDRSMGIWEKVNPALFDAMEARLGLTLPREEGTDAVNSIRAMHEGRSKVFFGMGGNILSAMSDTAYTAEALTNCDLTVHVSTKLNRSHLVTGKEALILPCLGRTELDIQRSGPQFVSTENSMSSVQKSTGHLSPASPHLLSEPMIVARMAVATLGPEHKVDWLNTASNYDHIRDHIAATVPGCKDYNRRVRQEHGFAMPNSVRDNRSFDTPDGFAHFKAHPIPVHDLAPDEYVMMTVRSHDQFNTVVYDDHDRYRGIHNGRHVVFMNTDDIREAGLEDGQHVDLVNAHGGRRRVAPSFRVVAYEIPRGCVATYFPEANVLVPISSVAHRSNTPASKFVPITIESCSAIAQT